MVLRVHINRDYIERQGPARGWRIFSGLDWARKRDEKSIQTAIT